VRRFLTAFATVLTMTLVATACRQYLPSNRYMQVRSLGTSQPSTADARGKFNHARHDKALQKASVTCVECHRFDAVIDTTKDKAAQEASARALHPGSAACHGCHVDDETRTAAAPQECTTCHENLRPLTPENHQVAWLKVHPTSARADSRSCESCHRQSFCVDCHTRRDTIQTLVHDRNFRFTHSIEARANPMQCGSCHRVDYCTNCHQQGKVGF